MCGNSFKVESTKKPDYTKDNPKQLKVHTNSRFLALRRLEGRHHSAALTGDSIKRSEGREAKPSGPERKAGEGIRTLDIRHGRPVRTRQSFENALCSDPNAVQHTITVPFVPLNS